MKIYSFLFLMMIAAFGESQSLVLPFDFESTPVTADFMDFDGGTASVLDNPQPIAPNTSGKVAQIVRNGGTIWAGSKIILDNYLDFSTNEALRMKVFSPVAGITVKFKLEGNAATERDVLTSVANQWETLTWDFTGEPLNTFNTLVFMFDFGNVGDGSANSTFLFDDIEQIDLGVQMDLPVDFEDPSVNYVLTSFEGNTSAIGPDPTNAANTVGICFKSVTAGSSAGTTIGTPEGFANPIPITAGSTKMNVRVYSPDAGIPIRLKIEDHTDPTRSVETEVQNTVANAWETLEFDFSNEAPGTAALNLSYTFDMASIFFNFGTTGATAGDKTYYFDDVYFGEATTGIDELAQFGITHYPNPVIENLLIKADQDINEVRVYNLLGQQVLLSNENSDSIDLNFSGLLPGFYLVKVEIGGKIGSFKVLKVR